MPFNWMPSSRTVVSFAPLPRRFMPTCDIACAPPTSGSALVIPGNQLRVVARCGRWESHRAPREAAPATSRWKHIDDRRRARHRDGLFEVADAQLGVHRRGEIGRQLQSLAPDVREPRQRERDGVHTRAQIDDLIQATIVGDRGLHLFDQLRACRFDRDARHQRALVSSWRRQSCWRPAPWPIRAAPPAVPAPRLRCRACVRSYTAPFEGDGSHGGRQPNSRCGTR